MKSSQPGPSVRSRRARVFAKIVTAMAIAVSLVALPNAAFAYTTTGTKWPNGSLQIDWRYVNGSFRTGLSDAVSNYNGSTDVSLSAVDQSGPTWTATNTNYGATGWEGQANWASFFGTTTSCSMMLNQYYLSGTEPVTRLKVVWAHEAGHCLGLDHVSDSSRVMYTSASQAYFNGVTGLTSDEIDGINSLY